MTSETPLFDTISPSVVFFVIRTCIHSRGCWVGEEFSRQTRRVFAGMLGAFQENATRYGGKRPAQTAFEVVNTGSKMFHVKHRIMDSPKPGESIVS